MGLPINKLYVTTNSNDIMHRTITNGDMSLKDVKSTISPSMDIQISSNFERQLFESLEYNSSKLSELMKTFMENKKYSLKGKIHDNLKLHYRSKGVNDELTAKTIKEFYNKFNYIADPHTATSLNILGDLDNDDILSVAELLKVGYMRHIYLVILISHIILSISVLPLALFSIYRGITGEFEKHKSIVKYTFPIWMYVAITGVLVYILMSPYY